MNQSSEHRRPPLAFQSTTEKSLTLAAASFERATCNISIERLSSHFARPKDQLHMSVDRTQCVARARRDLLGQSRAGYSRARYGLTALRCVDTVDIGCFSRLSRVL